VSLAWGMMYSTSGGYLPFIHPRSFPELGVFTRDEQWRLLHEANGEAGHWRSLTPAVVFLALFPFGSALWRTLIKVSTISDSIWLHLSVSGLVAVFGALVALRLGVHYIRPFLTRCIERAKSAG
jgi:hypothetical protein